MNLIETLNNDIQKASYRMQEIQLEKQLLDKEYSCIHQKKWELESYRDLAVEESEGE